MGYILKTSNQPMITFIYQHSKIFFKKSVNKLSYLLHKLTLFPFGNLYHSKYFSRLPTTIPQLNFQIFSSFTLYNFSNFIHFFTDGSKNETSVAAAFIARFSLYPARTTYLTSQPFCILNYAILLSLDFISHTSPLVNF